MFDKYKNGYDSLWKAIIRPPRENYTIKDLGPTQFKIEKYIIKRTDLQLKNKQNLKLECSFFQIEDINYPLPCVIYLHGNSSCRIEALNNIETLLNQRIQLFCFDFQGCGISEGEYISLGYYERNDLDCVIQYLRDRKDVSTIGLWGRSMGGITALMYSDRDPSIAGIVIDSAMTDLKTLAEQLCKRFVNIPQFVLNGALSLVKKSVFDRAKFDINDLTPIKHCQSAFIPALFAAAKNDTFIQPSHTDQLYKEYAGDKNLIMVEGDHNSVRPQFFQDSVAIFFHNTLQCDQLPKEAQYIQNKGNIFSNQKNQNVHKQQKKIGNEDVIAESLKQFSNQQDEEDQIQQAIKLSLMQAENQDKKQNNSEQQ